MRQIFTIIFSICICHFLYAQVAVTTDGLPAHASAALDIRSTSKGVLLPRMTYLERTGITTAIPGLLVYQTNTSTTPPGFYMYTGVGWKQIAEAEDVPGYGGWTITGSNLYSILGGNVGIGTSTPDYRLEVIGSIRSSTSGYFANGIGLGTTFLPGGVKLYATDGDVRLNNSEMQFYASGVEKGFIQLAGDNLRLGTISSNNTGSFVVRTNGSDRMTVDASGNVDINNNLTVNNGNGVIRNSGSGQLRYQTLQAPFLAILPAHGSLTANIAWGPFNSAPVAFVGNIVTSGGTSGELYRCILQLYNVTATGCDCKIINTDNAPINYNITWNIVLIGN